MSYLRKILITIGAGLIILGIFLPLLPKIPLFHLPGDIIIEKPNFKFYMPITSMIIISIVISLILWLIKKL